MTYDPNKHHRRSIRLKGYDYSQAGLYFVTICTGNRLCLFGEIVDDEMIMNDAGQMIGKWYRELENKFPDIKCHEMIVMPNHTHFIVENNAIADVGADLCVCPSSNQPPHLGEHIGSPLHRVVQWFKTMTTNKYIRGVKQFDWPRFDKKLWQRNYYEHIVRDEKSFLKIAEYIQNNPLKWHEDKYFG
jgi:REP element-mobilizing transposase RayT